MPARALDLSARDLMACQNDTPGARLGSVQRRAGERLCPMGPQGGKNTQNQTPYPYGV